MGNGRQIDVAWAVGTIYLGLPHKALVSEDVNSEGWCVRGNRSRRFQTLYNQILAEPIPDANLGDDIVMWKHGEYDYQEKFASSSTWEQIRPQRDKVYWRNVVWFLQGVPRYAFITWLDVLNRLSTGDTMRSWVIIQGCGLCGERDETRDHMFSLVRTHLRSGKDWWEGFLEREQILTGHTRLIWLRETDFTSLTLYW